MPIAECFSPKELLQIRYYIGDDPEPTDSELQLLGGTLETTDPLVVAQQVLGTRLGAMLNAPAQHSLQGDAQESWHQNISILRAQLKELDAKVNESVAPIAGAPAVQAYAIERDDRDRLWNNA